MLVKKIGISKLACFSTIMLFFIDEVQSYSEPPTESYGVIYGFKDGNSKAIYLSDQDGKSPVKIVKATSSDGYPAVSPLGDKVTFYGKYDNFKTWSIHTVDITGRNLKRLTSKKYVWDSAPAWSLDGMTIAFAREYENKEGVWQEEIWLMNADGSEQRQIKNLEGRAPEFMQDGRLLYQSKASPSQISIANLDGSEVIQLTQDDTDNMSPQISPDGTKIAYLSNRDGNQEVYVMDIDGANNKRLTRNNIQEWDPSWSPDGTKVYFASENVYGFYDVFSVNVDGTSIKKTLQNSSQATVVPGLDQETLQKLKKINKRQ
ncbi:TolB family protein [Pseudoalteromonas piscicida]|uniref:TolB family protein n=1 Tax=Pseudoalteromonas piscicida TaxID=43662 RepID=UPI003C7D2E8C